MQISSALIKVFINPPSVCYVISLHTRNRQFDLLTYYCGKVQALGWQGDICPVHVHCRKRNSRGVILIATIRCVLCVAVHVVNNCQIGTCKSGGVELLDLHATVAPRRQGIQPSPTLESFHFIPYDEQSLALSQLGTSVAEYAKTCESFVLERMHQLLAANVEDGLRNLKLMQNLVDDTSWTPPVGEKLTEYLASSDSVALKTVEKIFAVAHDDAFAQNVNSIVSASLADIIASDRLLSFARCDRCFKTCLDVVLENIPPEGAGGRIKVVECDAGTGHAYPHVMRQLSSQPGIAISYTAADPAPTQSIDAELARRLGVDTVEWSLESSKPISDRASGADLVILANVLHRHDSISASLSAASSLASDDGFLLIVEPTSNFAIPWSFFALTHDVTKMPDLSSRTCGPYCDEETWTKLLINVGLVPVAQKSDGVLHTVFLCRKVPSVSPSQAPRIIDVDDTSFSWLEEVKAVMAEERGGPDTNCSVWLRARNADSGIVGMLNCLRREPNGDCLR